MPRLIGSVVAGLALAFALVFVTDTVFHQLSAVTAPTTTDKEAMRLYVASQPVALLVFILLGWTLAACAGAALAARLGRGARPGWIVAGLFLVAISLNFTMVPHPTWMMVVGVVAVAVAGWLGARVAASGKPAPQVTA